MQYLRSRDSAKCGEKNRKQHAAFLAEVEDKPAMHTEMIDSFLTLPLWLDLPALQVVHACWHPRFIAWLAPRLYEGSRVLDEGDRGSAAGWSPLPGQRRYGA
jgi:hypothetical protein